MKKRSEKEELILLGSNFTHCTSTSYSCSYSVDFLDLLCNKLEKLRLVVPAAPENFFHPGFHLEMYVQDICSRCMFKIYANNHTIEYYHQLLLSNWSTF